MPNKTEQIAGDVVGGFRTIAIVDDDPPVRRFIAQALTRAGYSVIEANDAEAASAMIAAYGQVALVISDIRMPVGNGLDLAQKIEELRPGTPFLYMSGLLDCIAVESIVLRDPRAILLKPFTSRQLLDRVESITGRPVGGKPREATPVKKGPAREKQEYRWSNAS